MPRVQPHFKVDFFSKIFSVLFRVFNETSLATASDHVILVLLDITEAFDTVGHNILISLLQHTVGIAAVHWIGLGRT